MENTEKIVFLYDEKSIPDQIIEAAKAQTPSGFELVLCESKMVEEERRVQVAQADYFMLYTVGFEDIDIAKKAKLMQILSAGYDRLNVPELAEAGIPLATNGGANAPTVAEHTLLLILSLYRKLPLHHAALRSGKWLGHQEVLGLNELRGKQVGIVGFGKIGQEVARMVNGFLANVVYYDVFKAPDEVEQSLNARRLELDALLRTSDIVTLHTPLTESSRELINSKSLQSMKRNAILINTARGAAVVEKDLIDALEKGIIAGAGLDVFEKEPLGDSPLLSFENVVLTPHTAGSTIDTWWRRLDFAFENIQRVSRGEDPTFIVEV
jgi:phosphoglycerate dehydrogenase-like enzyme